MKKLITLLALIGAVAFATTPADYSAQLDLSLAGDSIAQTDAGRVVVKYFNHTTTAITNQVVALVEIPANSRIIGGHISIAAMGGTEDAVVGLIAKDGGGYINKPTTTADDPDLFLDNLDAGSGVNDTFGDFAAGDYDGYAGFDTDVYLTVGCESDDDIWVAAKAIKGWVMYIRSNN